MDSKILETAAGALDDAYRALVAAQGVSDGEATALLTALSILNHAALSRHADGER